MMFSKWSSLAVAILSAVAVVQGLSSSVLEKCGDDPTVISTKTFTSKKGSEIVIKTIACPGISKSEKRSLLSKRQAFDQCGVGCDLEGVEFDDPTPLQEDCIELGEDLEDLDEFFSAPFETVTSIALGTCGTSFINESDLDYEYCTTDWGEIVIDLAVDFIPSFSGGACIQPTSDWLIEVFG